jgi:putative membrane protein
MIDIDSLPALNASLNALATCFLVAGFIFIRKGMRKHHIACMASAIIVSAAFLTSYLIYHYAKEGVVTKFAHTGAIKTLYLFILITHIPLAALVPPLVILTVVPAVRARFDRHKRLARWTFPIWLYVSVTGVLVYMMLYRWFPGPG